MERTYIALMVLSLLCLNSRAQGLNIAENLLLLEGDNSTFESSMGSWTCNDNGACSRANNDGNNGYYLKLTNTGAGNDYDKQMEYSLSGHTPANGTRYVIKFWAKRNGSEGNGQIKVLLQKNSQSENWPQQAFSNNPFTVSNDWTHYEFELTANRGDYEVIKINFGNCGEIWIDDIEYGVYTANVAPTFTTDLNPSYTVGQGGTLNLSVVASGTPAPTYQWYSNTTNNTDGATPIGGATEATYSVPTTEQGIKYYYCVATNSQGSATSAIAGVTVTEPVNATGVTLDKTSASVKQGRTITLTATVAPPDAANKNVTWSSNNPSVATVSNGVVTGVTTGNAQITATTVDGNYTASCTVTVTTSLPPVMLYDFNDATDVSSMAYPSHPNTGEYLDRGEHLYIDIIQDPYSAGKCLSVSDGNHKDTETFIIDFGPSGVDFGGYGILAFDINFPEKSVDAKGQHESFNYKDVFIKLECKYTDGTTVDVPLQTFRTPVFPAPVWDTKLIPLTKKENEETVSVIPDGATPVKLKIGPLNSNRCIYLIDNIRIKENVDDVEDYTQDDDLSDIWWKYADETLYIKGTGPIPAYRDGKPCPWESRTDVIRYVVVSEGITAVGDYSIGNSQKEVVDITLHSIPEYFGEHCLERQYASNLTRYLHLELWDAEKPFIAKNKSTYFPTFNTAKYFRNVTNTYSTVCLPFPVTEATVTAAGAELFDFTSIEENGEQYTLAFTKHSGGMAAGQTYLVKKHDIEGTLQNANVTKDQFILTPAVSTNTITGSDPAFSISMTGVFQPSVFGRNIGTEQAPVYAYGFLNEKFYMNGGNMSVRPMRGYFYGSQLYDVPVQGQQQSAKPLPAMMGFQIVDDDVTGIDENVADDNAEGFEIQEVYNLNGVKTNTLAKGVNIIRTSTGKVMKVVVR